MAGPWTTIVSASELVSALPDETLVLLDCRHSLADVDAGPTAYAAGHLPGAVHAHTDTDLAGPLHLAQGTGRHPLPDPDAFRERCSAWGIGPDTQVVAYDDAGGAWAARAWWLLRHYGHGLVAVLDGGLQAAVRAGATLTTETVNRTPTAFVGAPGAMPTVGTKSIAARLPLAHGTVLDARARERYLGETEPLDPRAGHIPGALNAPYANNLDEEGRFRAPADLARHFRSLIGDRSGEEVVTYCGSGVTAAHNVLAMEVAGLGTAALYPASWSGWCADENRPAATGDETQE